MRSLNSLAMFVGALLTASVALAGGATAPAPSKQPAAGSSSAMQSTAEHRDMSLTKDQIKEVQHALAKNGTYKGKVDGTLGKDTHAALRHYQEKNHLPVTGNPDEQTLAKLGIKATSPVAAQAQKSPSGSSTTPD